MSDDYHSYAATFAAELRDDDDEYQPNYATLEPANATRPAACTSASERREAEGETSTHWSDSPAPSQELFPVDDESQDQCGHAAAQDTNPAESAMLPVAAPEDNTVTPCVPSSSASGFASSHAGVPAPPPFPQVAKSSSSRRHRQPPPAQVSRRLLCTDVLSFEDHERQLATDPKVVLEELGRTVDKSVLSEEYNDFLKNALHNARVDMNRARSLASTSKLLPQSSDSVVRELTTVVQSMSNTVLGLAAMIDGLQLRLEKQSVAVLNAKHQARPPFKSHNLKALLRSWVPNGRIAKSDFATLCTDFARHYFVVACEPAEAIQGFSVRVSSRGGKKEELRDLPERIVSTLVDFMLEAMGIGQPELERTSQDLSQRPTEFWLGLGRNNAERGAALDYRKSCRMSWTPSCRVSISKALADIRQYRMGADRLMPKPKRRRVPPQPEDSTELSSDLEEDLSLDAPMRRNQNPGPSTTAAATATTTTTSSPSFHSTRT
ncbi:hypothetical protein Aduo_007950 [Ancylostoma duodenale]